MLILNKYLAEIHKATGLNLVPKHEISSTDTGSLFLLESANNEAFVLKLFRNSERAETELNGLEELRKTGTVAVVGIVWSNDLALLLEFVPTGRPTDTAWRNFGQNLADLHSTRAPYFGFYEDNFIGQGCQLNAVGANMNSWVSFYGEFRLKMQFDLAVEKGLASARLQKGMERLLSRLPELIEDNSIPALLHGDLWSGNYLFSQTKGVVLIDPAVYYGHREAELAMMLLFGNVSSYFMDAYTSVSGLERNWESRIKLYQLYHVLNHLNIFGTQYLGNAESIVNLYI
jgi:fructosamine-3-kinase